MAVAFLTAACSLKTEQKPAASEASQLDREGSLMGEKLAVLVHGAIIDIVGTERVISSTEFKKFILAAPTGEAGKQTWSELWVFEFVAPDGTLQITIQQKNPHLYDVEIRTWNSAVSRYQFDTKK